MQGGFFQPQHDVVGFLHGHLVMFYSAGDLREKDSHGQGSPALNLLGDPVLPGMACSGEDHGTEPRNCPVRVIA